MSRLAKLLVVVASTIGIPATALGVASTIAIHHPLLAIFFILCWEVCVGVGALAARLLSRPAGRRLEQLGDNLDLAFGRRVSRYGRKYLQSVLSAERFIDTRGLVTAGFATPEFDDVYVDVSLAPQPAHRIPGDVLAFDSPDVTRRFAITDLLDTSKPSAQAVVGAPGSGKTTLLRHVARLIAEHPRKRKRPIPVLLALRDHTTTLTAKPLVALPELIRSANAHLPIAPPPGWWEVQLRRGRCVVLLDGLDEVARNTDRRMVANWINKQMTVYSNNDFVITSRPDGYRTAPIAGAQVLQVRTLTDDQVRDFVHRWYRVAERRATGATGPDIDERANKAAGDLLDRLRSNPALRDLTVNPLLLTMIANVHLYRGALPGSRAELYNEVCQVVLWRRQEQKGLSTELPGPTKQRILAELAFRMMRKQLRDLSSKQALELIRPALRRTARSVTAEAFLAEVGSNGILVEREKDLYAFAHQTFQEYLAAKHISENGLVAQLAESVDDSWWRETTLLYAADSNADPIIRACLTTRSLTALSLAYECVTPTTQLAPDLREELELTLTTAYSDNASTDQRRLVAGVLASRHFRTTIKLPSGVRICPSLVPQNIYSLFLRDTGNYPPSSPFKAEPTATGPVAGLWADDAIQFLHWINLATTSDAGITYRIPTVEELQALAALPHCHPQEAALTHEPYIWSYDQHSSVLQSATLRGLSVEPATISTESLWSAVTKDIDRSSLQYHLSIARARLAAYAISSVTDISDGALSKLSRSAISSLAWSLIEYLDHPFLSEFPSIGHCRRTAYDLLSFFDDSPSSRIRRYTSGVGHTYPLTIGPTEVKPSQYDRAHLLARVISERLTGTVKFQDPIDHALALDRLDLIEEFLADELRLYSPSCTEIDLNELIEKCLLMAGGLRATRPATILNPFEDYAASFTERWFSQSGLESLNMKGCESFTLRLHRRPFMAAADEARIAARAIRSTAPWVQVVGTRLAGAVDSMLRENAPLAPPNAGSMRLAALALAAEACQTGAREPAAIYYTLAADLVLIEHRLNSGEARESLVLALS